MNGPLKRGYKEIKQMLDSKFSEVLTVFFIYLHIFLADIFDVLITISYVLYRRYLCFLFQNRIVHY